ncbi:MAG: signal recognition particle-docking protein FtsY [Armatimonadota bacterium]
MFKRLMERVDRMLGRGKLDDEFYDGVEEALIAADTHPVTAEEILNELREAVRSEGITDPDIVRNRLKQAIADRFRQQGAVGLATAPPPGPTVYLFVGVNGAGKTTSIAKLAHLLIEKYDQRVILAAGDTFRAAASEQLEIWAGRVGADIVKNQPGADSATVLFDAIAAAKARGAGFVLCDTAGRQGSKAHLMAELEKISRVTQRALGHPPQEVLLVLDANTGQNAVNQAEQFTKAAGVTGIILTKTDGNSKGGALIGLFARLKVPIKFLGTGEGMDDLVDFKPDAFAAGLFS